MARIAVQVFGARETRAALRAFGAAAKAAVRREIAASAFRVQEGARRRCPVRTGALWRSITVDLWEDSAQVGPHMPYDAYVEFGTRRMEARPYLFPAAEEEAKRFPQALAEAVRRVAG